MVTRCGTEGRGPEWATWGLGTWVPYALPTQLSLSFQDLAQPGCHPPGLPTEEKVILWVGGGETP